MKFRIDKIPKTEEDMEEIVKEVEEEHGHEHHHHHEHEHDILDEILVSLQSLEGKVNQLSVTPSTAGGRSKGFTYR